MLGAGGSKSSTCIFSRIKLKKPHISLQPGFEVLFFFFFFNFAIIGLHFHSLNVKTGST